MLCFQTIPLAYLFYAITIIFHRALYSNCKTTSKVTIVVVLHISHAILLAERSFSVSPTVVLNGGSKKRTLLFLFIFLCKSGQLFGLVSIRKHQVCI